MVKQHHSRPGRYSRLLRWGLSRDSQAVPHLVGMLVSAVATVLITRAILAATGYPQVGGKTLHIAHVLWGGLLMILAMLLLLSFIGPVVRPLAAVVAGVGFGLFIDEVGKFVTSQNNYFYRPAPAIIYVVLMLLALFINALHGHRQRHRAEYLAGALDQTIAGVAGGFTRERRAAAQQLLARASGAVGAAEATALLAAIPEDPYELADPLQAVRTFKRRFFDRLVRQRLVRIAAVVVLVVESGYVVQGLGAQLYHRLIGGGVDLAIVQANSVSTAILLLGTVTATATGVLVVIGLIRLAINPAAAFGFFHHALLVNLLLTRVFQFEIQQFATTLFVVVDLLLLAVVSGERAHLRRRHSDHNVTAQQ